MPDLIPIRRVLLCGAGNFGSRWLQGLCRVPNSLQIDVFDPSKEALQEAATRANEVLSQAKVQHTISYSQSYDYLPKSCDLSIIATPSNVRAEVVASLSKCVNSRFWVIEKVLAQSLSQLRSITDSMTGQKAWVNTPRRSWVWYQSLRNAFPVNGRCDILIEGGPWDLIGNLPHYIDLISWWIQQPVSKIDCSGLDDNWFPSTTRNSPNNKSCYYTTLGKVNIEFLNKSSLTLNWSSKDEVKIQIKNAQNAINIFEVDGRAIINDRETIRGEMEQQSKSTPNLISKLERYGSLDLPEINESAELHSKLISALLPVWSKYSGSDTTYIPIS